MPRNRLALREKFSPPSNSWKASAATCTIGAYYRVGLEYVRDLQSAIYENGAVFASSRAPKTSWQVDTTTDRIPTIKPFVADGAHAFAIVGFNEEGLIIQNSHGKDWGYNGFAVLSYSDWAANRMDVWVAALGVPAKTTAVGGTGSKGSDSAANANQTEVLAGSAFRSRAFGVSDPVCRIQSGSATDPWDEERVYSHSVIMDDHGCGINRLVTQESAKSCINYVCNERMTEVGKATGFRDLVVFAHSGLESEAIAIHRASVLGPYFKANGVYPIFVSARTGFVETVTHLLRGEPPTSMYGEGVDSALRGIFQPEELPQGDARDQRIEIFCRRFVRPLWTQFRKNASVSGSSGGAIYHMCKALQQALSRNRRGWRKPRIHLVGHSAGAILVGELLKRLSMRKIGVETCSLYAPACSVDFAINRFGSAVRKGTLSRRSLHVDVLAAELESMDTVGGVYGKSLLWLMSQALEDRPGMPILGLQAAWTLEDEDLITAFGELGAREVEKWRKLGHWCKPQVFRDEVMALDTDGTSAPAAHDMFDNDINVATATLKRILERKKIKHPITSLKDFATS